MEWILWIVAALFFLLGAVCLVLVVFQLPGGWILLGLAFVIEICDRWYLPVDDRQTFGVWLLVTATALLALGEVIEFVAGVMGAQRAGSTRAGMWGALIGGIAGIFVFAPLVAFIPIFGALVAAVVGTFVGALLGELTARGATVQGSMRPAIGATIGRVLGTTGKVAVTIAVWLSLSFAAFWP